MPRNLVICCDGTSNQFSKNNTNVVRLAQILDRDPGMQRLYYDPGVGTLPEPGRVTAIGKWFSEVLGLAIGYGLIDKVAEAYTYLMNWWEPGDQVFLFGFSRGAYTVRVLSGVLHSLGLLPAGNDNLVPYVMRLFKGSRNRQSPDYWRLLGEFRVSFARPVKNGDATRHFPVHFLGLWDTVSSVGWIWDPATYPFTAKNPSVRIVRHAISIDERRAFFRQNRIEPADGQNVEEHWFPGVHCDIGGGYPDPPKAPAGLWRASFDWMIQEATSAGLLIDAARQQKFLRPVSASVPPWAGEQHESLKGLWWLAEIFPKLRWSRKLDMRLPLPGLGRRREIKDAELMDQSTLFRIRQGTYSPPNLSPAFLDYVRSLQIVPVLLPYVASPVSTATGPTGSATASS
jgi:uncharacterized protein (DUF2235 family)